MLEDANPGALIHVTLRSLLGVNCNRVCRGKSALLVRFLVVVLRRPLLPAAAAIWPLPVACRLAGLWRRRPSYLRLRRRCILPLRGRGLRRRSTLLLPPHLLLLLLLLPLLLALKILLPLQLLLPLLLLPLQILLLPLNVRLQL